MLYSYQIEQAIRAASILHAGQKRKGSAPYPYISHLMSVAVIVSDYSDDPNVFIAALLHDTLEDTDYTVEELEADFGEDVRMLVETVTDATKRERKSMTHDERRAEYLKKLKSTTDQRALIIAAGDKIHNMRSVVEEYHDDPSLYTNDFPSGSVDAESYAEAIHSLLNAKLRSAILKEYNHVYKSYRAFLERAFHNG